MSEEEVKLKEDVIKFAPLLKEPVFLTMDELKGDFNWLASDDERSEPEFNIITCDACLTDELETFVRCYTVANVDLCIPCYNKLRRAATDPGVAEAAEKRWRAELDELLAQAREQADKNQYSDLARNTEIWNMVNSTPCPFTLGPLYSDRVKKRAASDIEPTTTDPKISKKESKESESDGEETEK